MIREDYVNFEIAKLLKEKGFDWKCHAMYDKDGHLVLFDFKLVTKADKRQFVADAPTLQIAMKWLREVHNLSVEIYRTACGYVGCIVAIPSGTDIKFLEDDGDDLPSGQYTTYEKAVEAALKYCLTTLI